MTKLTTIDGKLRRYTDSNGYNLVFAEDDYTGCCCGGSCGIVEERVYFGNMTGAQLLHDGDSHPNCGAGRALPERITGSFTLGTADGCGDVSCGGEIRFRFWRNLFSTCRDGNLSDITTQTVVVACTNGSVEVRLLPATVHLLNSGNSHTFSSIDADPNRRTVIDSSAGQCFSVAAVTPTASFTVEATLNWSGGTDHDLYGMISCGGCGT